MLTYDLWPTQENGKRFSSKGPQSKIRTRTGSSPSTEYFGSCYSQASSLGKK